MEAQGALCSDRERLRTDTVCAHATGSLEEPHHKLVRSERLLGISVWTDCTGPLRAGNVRWHEHLMHTANETKN